MRKADFKISIKKHSHTLNKIKKKRDLNYVIDLIVMEVHILNPKSDTHC